MLIALHVIAGPDKGQVFQLVDGEPLLLGRSRHCLSPLKDPSVSRVHCEIELEDGQVIVNDHESGSGTFVNGQRIVEQVLQPGDILQLGDTQLRFDAPRAAPAAAAAPPAPKPKPTVLVGDRLQELSGKMMSHFHVGRVRAKGQSGLIFEARDFKDDSPVALKVLFPAATRNNKELRRFVRAMRTVLPLRHPNLVALKGAGKSGPYCWAAMELVEGQSLTQMIQQLGIAGMLDWRHAFRVAIHIGRALEYAHGESIIHRNLTPQNILQRSSDKIVKLGDLMLAKALEGTLAEQLTKPGEMLGDIRYMAPERTEGSDRVDERSDLYSLGALLYTLLTGKPAFEGRSIIDTLMKIRTAQPEPPRKFQMSIPDRFQAAVLRLMAKRPEDRFQMAKDLLLELNRIGKLAGVTVP
jgi:serine/threonine protein kinase